MRRLLLLVGSLTISQLTAAQSNDLVSAVRGAYCLGVDQETNESLGLPTTTENSDTRDQNALIDASDNWVRRKLWLIKQTGILEKVPPSDIRRIAGEFGIQVTFETTETAERLVMPSDKKALKTLLRFLDEDYYKSPLSNTNFISNSKRPV